MTTKQPESPQELRRRAEEQYRLDCMDEDGLPSGLPLGTQNLLHELRVHQIELEMQNEELRQTQAELEAARSRYFDLYYLAPVGYLTFSEKGLIREANLAAATMIGVARSDLLNKPMSQFISPEDQDTYYQQRKKLLESGEPVEWDMRMLHADGSSFWVHLHANSMQDGNYQIAFSDISIRKQDEQALQAKNIEMERFTYTVSHDLKSPLITIQSYAGMILKEMEAGRYERAIGDMKRIEDAAGKMNTLLGDLLELSRIGRQMNESSLIDMNRLVKDTLAQLAGPIMESQAEMVVQSDLPALNGDHKRIAEVVQNLVENAIKYRGDQAAPRIEIGTRQDGKECVFFVKDNGAGIDTLQHERVFGLFKKLDADSEGTGVGLALVKRIIEVHGGRVWVESEGEGMGSRFCFTVGL